VAKFSSWFKGKTAKSNQFQGKKPALPSSDEGEKPTENESLAPTKLEKAKQFLTKAKTVSSTILDKLPGAGKPLYRRSWFWAGLGVTGGIVGLNYGIWSLDQTLPSKADFSSVVREQTLTIKAADGTVLQQQGEVGREQLLLEQIPEKLKKAFIASEDRRFEQHNGVDNQGILRAVWNNLRSQNVVEGGSTITQQLARILFLKQERTVWRKVKEMRLAQKMEEELTKDQILERYLNLVYLGSGAYGVADAAQVYFSKPVSELTLGEMATIAGLAPAPSVFSPAINAEVAKQRRNLVLQRMFEDKVITDSEKQAAMSEAIVVKKSTPKRQQVDAPYFTSFVQKELPKIVPANVLQSGGLTVETTLNPAWQKSAEEAIAKTLRNQGRWQRFKQAAMVAINPRNGEIKAMVGGSEFGKYQFNRVTQAQRQPGSTFKSFVYAAAMATGMSPYKSYLDAPLIVDGYEPKNYDEGFRGYMTIRDALTKSVNIVAVKTLMDVGFNPTIKLAQSMGIKSPLKPTYSLALGSNEVNLLEITGAYGTLAANGLHVEPHGITRVLNRRGEVVWQADFQPKRVLDADSAAITTWMLRNVVTSGTGQPAQLGNRPVAGKTGTTDDVRDLWFIGYIPQLVTGVWLGNDDNRPTWGNSGTAAYAWNEFMEEATKGMTVEMFSERPKKLEGRKATIKAEGTKPRRVRTRSVPIIRDGDDDNNNNDDGSFRRRRRTTQNNFNSNNDNNDGGDDNSNGRSRRMRRRVFREETQTQQQDFTPRRRRSSFSQQQNDNNDDDNSSSRRRIRRQRYRSDDSNSSQSSGESFTPRRRRIRQQDNGSSSSPPPRRVRQRSTESAPPPRRNSAPPPSEAPSPPRTPSWRERLRPSDQSSNSSG
jgi:penicillin-binding protein 1A